MFNIIYLRIDENIYDDAKAANLFSLENLIGIHVESIRFLRNPSHFDSGIRVKVDQKIDALIQIRLQIHCILQTLTPMHSFDTS